MLTAPLFFISCEGRRQPPAVEALELLRIAGEDAVILPEYPSISDGKLDISDWNTSHVFQIEIYSAVSNLVGIIECNYESQQRFPDYAFMKHNRTNITVININEAGDGYLNAMLYENGKLHRMIASQVREFQQAIVGVMKPVDNGRCVVRISLDGQCGGNGHHDDDKCSDVYFVCFR